MKVSTVGRKINLRQNFIDGVERRMAKFDRYFDDPDATATVTATLEKDRHTAEITLKSKGLIYRAERTANSLEAAFNDAADTLIKQIVKNKDKLGSRIKKGTVELPQPADEPEEKGTIVREKTFAVEPMTPEDAVLQMNMLGHNFFLFKNKSTGAMNVVYRRNDGNYGLLIPLD